MAKADFNNPGTKQNKAPALMLVAAAIMFMLQRLWGDGVFNSSTGYVVSAIGTAAAVLYVFQRVTNNWPSSKVTPLRRKLGWFRKTLCTIFFVLGAIFLLSFGGAVLHGDLAGAVGLGLVSATLFIVALTILFKR